MLSAPIVLPPPLIVLILSSCTAKPQKAHPIPFESSALFVSDSLEPSQANVPNRSTATVPHRADFLARVQVPLTELSK
ncbi:hypothetical protein L1987_63255 [Smallanthus sonchifolius]|uniref:Uncharacterized protein n=1 Tax=Smallanthus sonchifolius TaxID=185202 RepID=A0ACB9CCU2_9ASTR|nr:hypothetical protein L1987_63255 [Smallanthus sonchifolius]